MKTLLSLCAVLPVLLFSPLAGNAYAETKAAHFVSPARADSLASPLTFRTIQTGTEADNSGLYLPHGASPARYRIGVDTYIRSGNRLYDLPASFAVTPDLQAQLNIPVADYSFSGSGAETGIGDIRLSIKFRTDQDESYESYFIFTAKFPSGDADKGLGTGAYDFSFTHKSMFMCGGYRTTLMAGVIIPPPVSVTVLGSSVIYTPAITYMAATERVLSSTDFRFGVKAAGLHAFSSRIDSELQKNAVTTLDIIPEVSYRFSDSGSITAGIIVPALTLYDLPGAANKRDPIFTISLYKSF